MKTGGRVLLEGLQPTDFIPHLIRTHPVKQVEQATHRFTHGGLIGDDDPIVFLAALQPVQMKSEVVCGIEGEEGSSFRSGISQLLFIAEPPNGPLRER